MTFVNGYCIIRNNRVIKDHSLLFELPGADRLSFLHECYLYLEMNYPKFYKMNALSQLGILASEVLLGGRALAKEYGSNNTGIVLSNANSSLDADIDYLASVKEIASPSLFVYTLPNIVSGEICIRHQIKGENAFLVFERFDAPFLSYYVERMMEANSTKVCLAGWVDVGRNAYDAFLYVVEKQKKDSGLEHTADNLLKLYISE